MDNDHKFWLGIWIIIGVVFTTIFCTLIITDHFNEQQFINGGYTREYIPAQGTWVKP